MIISWERIQVEFLGRKFCRHPTGIQTLLPLTHVYTPLVTWGLYLDSCTLRQLLTTKASLRTTLRIQAKWLDTQQTYCLPVVIEVVLLGDIGWTTVLATSEPLWPGPNRWWALCSLALYFRIFLVPMPYSSRCLYSIFLRAHYSASNVLISFNFALF